jgi:hypothetical protein
MEYIIPGENESPDVVADTQANGRQPEVKQLSLSPSTSSQHLIPLFTPTHRSGVVSSFSLSEQDDHNSVSKDQEGNIRNDSSPSSPPPLNHVPSTPRLTASDLEEIDALFLPSPSSQQPTKLSRFRQVIQKGQLNTHINEDRARFRRLRNETEVLERKICAQEIQLLDIAYWKRKLVFADVASNDEVDEELMYVGETDNTRGFSPETKRDRLRSVTSDRIIPDKGERDVVIILHYWQKRFDEVSDMISHPRYDTYREMD